jgi:Protein of unknown function (DUF2637)
MGLQPPGRSAPKSQCVLAGEFTLQGALVSARVDRWIRQTTISCVGVLALIAGTASYLHVHLLLELYGQPGWVAALTPLMSVDGMIVAASTTLLAESCGGSRGG